jgi:hypothetical protein
MRGLGYVLVLSLALSAPAQAQQTCVEGEDCGVMDRLGQLLNRLDPWFADLAEMLGDLSGWHAPEILPNGDILIRRRQPAEDENREPVTEPMEL